MYYICNGNVEISWIKVLNFTYFLHFFMKVTLLNLLFGSAFHDIYQNLYKIVLQTKFYLFDHVAITIFLVLPLLALETGYFSEHFYIS